MTFGISSARRCKKPGARNCVEASRLVGDVAFKEVAEVAGATLVFVKQRERWMLAGLHLSPIAGPPS